jgi:hypothetical protein
MEGQPKRKVSNCQEELSAGNRSRKCGKREQETPEERDHGLRSRETEQPLAMLMRYQKNESGSLRRGAGISLIKTLTEMSLDIDTAALL